MRQKNENMNHNKSDVTDRPFEFNWYDKEGYLNYRKMIKYSLGILTLGVFIVQILVMSFYLLLRPQVSNGAFDFIINLIQWNFYNFISIFKFDTRLDYVFVNMLIVLPIIYYFRKFFIKVKEKALFQSKMARMSLEQYYIHKKNLVENTYHFKKIKGQRINFEQFEKSKDDVIQLYDCDDCEFKRIGTDGDVLVQFTYNFPHFKTIGKYKLNYKDLLEEGYLLLGYTSKKLEEKIDGIKQVRLLGDASGYFRMYISLDMLLIHMKVIGGSGFGKSNNLHSFMNSFLLGMDSIDMLLVHDFKGIESRDFQQLKDKNPHLKDRIHTSTTMRELYNLLIKLEIIYQYRLQVMNKKGIKNYDGSKIILIIDEYNFGFSKLEDNDKGVKLLAQKTERMIKNVRMLYRAMGIYLLVLGQSSLAENNFRGRLNKQTTIEFHLRNTGNMVARVGENRYQDGKGEVISNYSKGQTLYVNHNDSTYFKFLACYIPDEYLNDYVDFVPKPRKQQDINFTKYLEPLKNIMIEERRKEAVESLRLKGEDIENADEEIEMFVEDLTKNIEELKKGIFVKKEKVNNIIKDEFNDFIKKIEKENDIIDEQLKLKQQEQIDLESEQTEEENVIEEPIQKPITKKKKEDDISISIDIDSLKNSLNIEKKEETEKASEDEVNKFLGKPKKEYNIDDFNEIDLDKTVNEELLKCKDYLQKNHKKELVENPNEANNLKKIFGNISKETKEESQETKNEESKGYKDDDLVSQLL